MNRPALPKNLRSELERSIQKARSIAEKAARDELIRLGVPAASAPTFLSDGERALRRNLRIHGRQLGDVKRGDDTQDIDLLSEELAYEHWHRMLFARFLIENGLLIHPSHGVAVSFDELEHEATTARTTPWQMAGSWACTMLPQIFRIDHPAFWIRLDDNAEATMEALVAQLPLAVFRAGDSLGWVYQFWQAKRKDEVNASGNNSIGAHELPAVTQLFTEPYMVSFLLDNALGAWWARMRLGSGELKTAPSESALRSAISLSGVPLDFLRFVKDDSDSWQPAAGGFERWPDSLDEFKVLDPCCGSGHFLVALLEMIVPMRMVLEGLSARQAVNLVLSQNLHALELDKRCVELAAFNLALSAWLYPNAGGYRPLPVLHIGCSGLGLSAAREEWQTRFDLRGKNQRIALDWLYDTFQNAPILGSLINPARHQAASLIPWNELSGLLQDALKSEDHSVTHEAGVVAQGLSKAAELLAGQYQWVVTNVPYLFQGKHCSVLADFCEANYTVAKNDLATVFLDRCLEFCVEGGTSSIVLPQNWLFLTSYKKFREKLLKQDTWHLLARLGEHGFDSSAAAGAFVALISLSRGSGEGLGGLFGGGEAHLIRGIDVSEPRTAGEKAVGLVSGEILSVEQGRQVGNPDARVTFEDVQGELLSKFAYGFQGITTGDNLRFITFFWEIQIQKKEWNWLNSTGNESIHYSGMDQVFLWDQGKGYLASSDAARIQGQNVWGTNGIAIRQMRILPATLNLGNPWDMNCSTIIPLDKTQLPAIWCFCSSPDYNLAVRRIDQKLNVTNATLVKVPFDLEYWTAVAAEKYPNGLPKPYTNDPTQWIFHGHPCASVIWDEAAKKTAAAPARMGDTVLQVAVARLLGYRWPAELDPAMELAEEQRAAVESCASLLEYTDDNGIVCIPAVRSERPAVDRLKALLRAAYSGSYDEDALLSASGSGGLSLESWLRDKFFEQHCKLFNHRPFIWQIWDGDPQGFSALVNYHRLTKANLERLTYTYLGDWITQSDAETRRNVAGAETRLVRARALQEKLKTILAGESPFDIFVRWKPLSEQPLGWEPDLNDGIRLNIRPFVTAEVLRHYKKPKLNLSWDKDRGKDVESAPWFATFQGDRINDHHTTLKEKRGARTGL